MLNLVGRDVTFLEIAGNDEILVTILGRGDLSLPVNATTLFQVPLQAREGWMRYIVVVPVKDLGRLVRAVDRSNAIFEHAYDY